ncbi:MAG: hypothetical protein HYZ81_01600 [Nitrospinae bacterium]|nr:hypothetical protein [Nitrospinota bacterium]
MRRWTQFAETLGLHLLMTADHAALTPYFARTVGGDLLIVVVDANDLHVRHIRQMAKVGGVVQ